MKLLILSGAEATCKSALAKELATQLGFVYASKDVVKEKLFDSEQRNTWDFAWYEARAKELFFDQIAQLIKDGNDVIIESNFIGKDRERLEKLIEPSVQVSEIHCYTRGYRSVVHFVERNESGHRHKGHHDRRWYPKVIFQTTMHLLHVNIGAHRPVHLSSRVMNLDTTDFPTVDYQVITRFITAGI